MRGKRAKQYRKLMQQYGLTFGFREPYQVLVDAQMIQDTECFKMDLVASLERTLSGKIKPMITQCSMRHLYTLTTLPSPQKETLIATAKTMERRRCNHHTLDAPLSTLECLSSVIDPKNSHTNKNRYVVASQEEGVRRCCRGVNGVPLVYVKRSVMVMEPMSEGSVGVREGVEREKFRSGLRGRVAGLGKRKREEGEVDEGGGGTVGDREEKSSTKKLKGPKGPNPLSVRKPKSASEAKAKLGEEGQGTRTIAPPSNVGEKVTDSFNDGAEDGSHPNKRKKKRRRKAKEIDGLRAATTARSGDDSS